MRLVKVGEQPLCMSKRSIEISYLLSAALPALFVGTIFEPASDDKGDGSHPRANPLKAAIEIEQSVETLMEEALDPAASIYEGIWTDWSKSSKPWGWTWTLSPNHAVLVTSSLAVFVTLAGSQLWSITRFTLHQSGAKSLAGSPSTPNHKKEQVVLRNATTDLATARLMAYLAWRSRQRAGRVYPRTVTIAVIALFHAILFMVAGTFSNLAISAGSSTDGSMVLSRSKHCGIWNETYFEISRAFIDPSSTETIDLGVEFEAKKTHNTQLSLEYAQKCYRAEDSYSYKSGVCNTMKKRKLDWSTATNGTCPFAKGMCRDDANVIVMDTGDIDSHNDLGINARSSDRLTYRRITQCAVLNDTDHITGWNGTIVASRAGATPDQPSNIAKAFYGPSNYKNTDWTYAYSNFAQFFNNFSAQATVPYQIDAETAWALADPKWSDSDFEPIDELFQKDADLVLFFLSYTGTYIEAIDDPWFSAHQEQFFDGSPPLMETRFGPDSAISTIACTEQHRFCTSNGACTSFAGFDQVQNDKTFLDSLTPSQNATFDRLLRAATEGSMKVVINGLQVTNTPLLASNYVAVGATSVTLHLPDTQWELELDYWHSIAMAQLQRTVVQWATGQIAAQTKYILPPETEQDKWFCQNLMIPSTVYQSFSIWKMILIFVFGAVVIVLSLNIEAVARAFRKCFRKTDPQTDWEHDDMLKLRVDMRESLWPPTLPSPRPPPPPPKSPHYDPTGPSLRPERSPEVRSTVRQVPGSLSDDDSEWKRSSSPTLPLEDRAISVLSGPVGKPDGRYLAAPGPIYRHDRDSWMAISLDDLHATTSDVPMTTMGNRDMTQESPIQDIPSPPRMQRLRNPIQFHLPRPQGSWV